MTRDERRERMGSNCLCQVGSVLHAKLVAWDHGPIRLLSVRTNKIQDLLITPQKKMSKLWIIFVNYP